MFGSLGKVRLYIRNKDTIVNKDSFFYWFLILCCSLGYSHMHLLHSLDVIRYWECRIYLISFLLAYMRFFYNSIMYLKTMFHPYANMSVRVIGLCPVRLGCFEDWLMGDRWNQRCWMSRYMFFLEFIFMRVRTTHYLNKISLEGLCLFACFL